MLKCTNCGTENQLGRVFCSSCGQKLDLTHMTSEEVQEKQQKSWFARFWWLVLLMILLVVGGVVGVGMWPNSDAIGEMGSRGDGRKVADMLSSLSRLRKNMGGARSIGEEEINAYFRYYKTPKALGATPSVKFEGEQVHVRVVTTTRIDLKFKVFNPTVSYDLVCGLSEDGLVPRKVMHGHLPAIGPIKGYTVKQAQAVFSKEKEWKGLEHISSLKFSKDKLFVQYDNK